MKRVWLGVVVSLFSSVFSLLAYAPYVEANSSNNCIGQQGCIVLVVNLNAGGKPGPTTAATVTAKRQNALGQDDNFTLSPNGSNNSYTSGGMVFGTGPSDNSCNNVGPAGPPATNPTNMFIITVSGSATGTFGPVNLCANENPKAAGGVKTVTVAVQVAGQTATLGGISGTFNTIDLAGNNRPCPDNSTVTFSGGPTTGKTTTVTGGKGGFNSGLVLAPGTYQVNVNCVINGQAFPIQVSGVVVTAGQTKAITGTCNGQTTQCGNNGQTIPSPVPAADDDTPPPDCDAGAFTWLICTGIKLVLGAIDWIRETVILPFLDQEPLDKNTGTGKTLYPIWATFRNIASVFLILIFFLTIFGTAFGYDNYTIKKTLPRLIAAAVLMPFSWYLCVFVHDLCLILAHGLLSLTSTFIPEGAVNFRSNLSKVFLGGAVALVGAGIVGAIATVSAGLLITILLALLAVLIAFVIRDMILNVLYVTSALAVLAYAMKDVISPAKQVWNIWWTNDASLEIMLPEAFGLLEAGRFFAYIAGHSQGMFTDAVKPFIQVAALTVPTGLIATLPSRNKSWLGSATKAVGRLQNAADKRFGKDSNWAKDRAAERERMNLIREDNSRKAAAQAAMNGEHWRARRLNMAAAGFRARSGVGSGFGGLQRGGLQAQLRRDQALSKARTATAQFGAMSSDEIPRTETADQRIAAEQREILDRLSAERGARSGLLQQVSESGENGRQRTNNIYQASMINSKRDNASKAGTNQGVIDAETANGQGAAEVAAAARIHAGEKEVKARGDVRGTRLTADEVDLQAAGDTAVAEANARRAANNMRPLNNTEAQAVRDAAATRGGHTSAARIARLQGAAAAAQKGAKDHFTEAHGKDLGINRVEGEYEQQFSDRAVARANAARALAGQLPMNPDEVADTRRRAMLELSQRRTNTAVGAAMLNSRTQAAAAEELKNQGVHLEGIRGQQEATADVITNARLQARTRIAAEKKERMERVKADGVRHLSDRNILDAAGMDAHDKATREIGDTLGILNAGAQSRLEGETTRSKIRAAAESTELKKSNEIGDRIGINQQRAADRQKVLNERADAYQAAHPGTSRATALRAAKAGNGVNRQRVSEHIRVAAEHAEAKYSADSGARKELLDAAHVAEETARAEGRDYHQTLLQAGAVKGKQDADAQQSRIQGLVDSIPFQNDHKTDQAAGRISTVTGEAKAAGDRRGIYAEQQNLEDREMAQADERLMNKLSKQNEKLGMTPGAARIAARNQLDSVAAAADANTQTYIAAGMNPRQAAIQGRRDAGDKSLSRETARRNTIATRGKSAEYQTAKREAQAYADAEGTVSGTRKAENEVLRLARAEEQQDYQNRYNNYIAGGMSAGQANKQARADVKATAMTRAQASAQVMNTATNAASIITDRRVVDSYGQDRGVVIADAAAPISGKTRIAAAQYTSTKQSGAQLGDVRAAARTAAAEAQRYGQEVGSIEAGIDAANRSARSSEADTTKRLAENFGNEQANINVGQNADGRNSAEAIAERTEYASEIAKMAGAREIKADLKEQHKAIDKRSKELVREAGKRGITISKEEADDQARQSLMNKAGNVSEHNQRMKTGKMYEEIEGGSEGINDEIMDQIEYIKKYRPDSLKGLSSSQQRDLAREQIYTNIADTASRTGYNKVVADVRDARGIEEGRTDQRHAAKVEIAKTRGLDPSKINVDKAVSDDEANKLIGSAAGETIQKEAREKLLNSTGKEIGTYRTDVATEESEMERIKAEAHNNGKFIPSDAQARMQARRNLSANRLRRMANDASLSEGQEAGQDLGIVQTADRAAEIEAENTLTDDHTFDPLPPTDPNDPLSPPHPIRLQDGTEVEASSDGKIHIPKGKVLLADSADRLRAENQDVRGISIARARTNIVNKAVTSGREMGIRSQAVRQGSVSALDVAAQAAAPDIIDQRLVSGAQNELDKLSNETNKIQADYDIARSNMIRGYQESVQEGAQVARDRAVDDKMREASNRVFEMITKDGNPLIENGGRVTASINQMTNDDNGNATLKQIARNAYHNNDEATLYAAARRLGNSDSGRDELADLRLELFQGATFDSNGVENFGVKAPTGKNLRMLERVLEGVNATGSKDLIKGDRSAFNPKNMSANEVLGWDNNMVNRLAEYTDRLRESAKRAAASGDAKTAAALWKERQDVLTQMDNVSKEIKDNKNLDGRMNDAKRAAFDTVLKNPARLAGAAAEWLAGPATDSSKNHRVLERYKDHPLDSTKLPPLPPPLPPTP
jgi:hypothetical protein